MKKFLNDLKTSFLESEGPKNLNESVKLYLKGFLMGTADIIPGVSGGTVAFITGIYENLINALSSFDLNALKLLLRFDFKNLFKQIPLKFLVILFLGILSAIISIARVMHYLMSNFPEYTWSLFFGLILSSCIVLSKNINHWKNFSTLFSISLGIVFGYVAVSLIPVQTPDNLFFIYICGLIAISAMILPGISGSFLLLILGKYAFITGAIKNPFNVQALIIITVFSLGCLTGLLSFSKILKHLLSKYSNLTFSFLTGLMIGTLKKIWPFKLQVETILIRGKEYVLKEVNILPAEFNTQIAICLSLAVVGFILVLQVESFNKKNTN